MLDPKQLEMMVLKVLEQLEKEKAVQTAPQKQLFFILPDSWKDTYLEALQRFPVSPEYRVTVVLPSTLYNEYYGKLFKKLFPKGSIAEQSKLVPPDGEFITVFPFPSRGLIAKTALCIADSFDTQWIEQCFSLGQKILMLQDGMEPFSGKEPKAYRSKIEDYIRTLSDFGIELTNHLPQTVPCAAPAPKEEQTKSAGKRIITEADLGEFMAQKKLVLHQGDVITMLAKERAGELGIQVIKA